MADSTCGGSASLAAYYAAGTRGARPILMGRSHPRAPTGCGLQGDNPNSQRTGDATCRPKGVAEAADFAMQVGPVEQATLNASEEQREAVCSSHVSYFQNQGRATGHRVTRRNLDCYRAGLARSG
jgi:hypothetical protein